MYVTPALAAGESKVKLPTCVPATAPTVTKNEFDAIEALCIWHVIAVRDVQAAVAQSSAEIIAEWVKSMTPNDRPLTVIDAPVVTGTLNAPLDAKGASNVNDVAWVPATAPTVTLVEDCSTTGFTG